MLSISIAMRKNCLILKTYTNHTFNASEFERNSIWCALFRWNNASHVNSSIELMRKSVNFRTNWARTNVTCWCVNMVCYWIHRHFAEMIWLLCVRERVTFYSFVSVVNWFVFFVPRNFTVTHTHSLSLSLQNTNTIVDIVLFCKLDSQGVKESDGNTVNEWRHESRRLYANKTHF